MYEFYLVLSNNYCCNIFVVPQPEVDLLFDQVMLSELRGTLEVLDARVFAELRSYMDPPPVVNLITKALLAVFDPEKSSEEWNNYKSVRCITSIMYTSSNGYFLFFAGFKFRVGEEDERVRSITCN